MTAKETWKPVMIGGVTGILMGAGAMYGVQAVASSSTAEALSASDAIKVAEVDDAMSFKEAFEAARSQVGAGGVFTWHGKVFNTYTAAEWQAMSNEERQLFAEQVKPEVSAAEVDTKQLAQETSSEDVQVAEAPAVDDDVQISANQGYDVEHTTQQHNGAELQATTWNSLAQEDNDVRVIGFKDVEISGGRSVAMQELEINGQRVAIIDVDRDGNPDLAMTDLNHNRQMDEGEVIDLHTGEAITFDNNDAGIDNVPEPDNFSA